MEMSLTQTSTLPGEGSTGAHVIVHEPWSSRVLPTDNHAPPVADFLKPDSNTNPIHPSSRIEMVGAGTEGAEEAE